MDTLYFDQIKSDRANTFAVPFGSNYAIFWNMCWPTAADWNPASAEWTISLIAPDSATITPVPLDTAETIIKKNDRVLYYNLISDGSEARAIYSLPNGIAGFSGYTSGWPGTPGLPGFSGYSGYSGFSTYAGFPCVYTFSSNNSLVFHTLREVNAPSVCQLTHNRFLMNWWSNFYNDYNVEKDGYTDDATKMIRTTNTTRPTDTYKKAMLGSFIDFRPVNIKIKYPGATEVSNFYNIFYPIFSKPIVINVQTDVNEPVSGSGGGLVRAVSDAGGAVPGMTGLSGYSGNVYVKNIKMKANIADIPNFTLDGDPYGLTYIQP